MRPHAKRHSDPADFLIYMLRPGSELLGGTVAVRNRKDAIQRFKELGEEIDDVNFYLHLTLSLPVGMFADQPLWLEISATTLKQFGLDPEAVPWVAVRHTDSNCDHIHIGICLVDFVGRLHKVVTTKLQCERAHAYLCTMLGLPAPAYFGDTALPRLEPIIPARNLNSAQKKSLNSDLQHVFIHRQPETLAELDQALALRSGGFRAEKSMNKFGTLSFSFSNLVGQIRGGTIGRAYRPRAFAARLAFSATLRRLRYALDLDHLIQIFRTPNMEKLLEQTITAAKAARTPGRYADYLQAIDADRPQRNGALSVDRPPETSRRSDRNAGRKTGPAFDGSDRNPSTLSATAESDDRSFEESAMRDPNIGQTDAGNAGATGTEGGPAFLIAGTTGGVTLGALITRICRIATKRAAGWRITGVIDGRSVGIDFADHSAAAVTVVDVEVTKGGEDAQAFADDYHVTIAPNNIEDDTPSEEPDEGLQF